MSSTNEKMSVIETDRGLVFILDEDIRETSSIVVEVNTKNHPLFYGAGDLNSAEDRVDMVTLTKSGILIHKSDDTELAVPVNIADEDKREAKIYQYGRNSHVWTWFKASGETFIKEVQVVECGEDGACLCQKGVWIFTDHVHTIKIS